MKHYEVVCALLINEVGQIFCCKRGPGRANEGLWEFPGGKIEKNESMEIALKREIKEELKCEIEIINYVGVSNYTYTNLNPFPDFSITMYGYFCKLLNEYSLTEHTECKWSSIENLEKLEFAEADKYFIKLLRGI